MPTDPATKQRYGCLTLLALVTVVMAILTRTAPPADGDAITAVLGFFLLAILYAYSGINWLSAKCHRDTRGFPVVMKQPQDESSPPPAHEPND